VEFAPGNEARESGDFKIKEGDVPEKFVKKALRKCTKGRGQVVMAVRSEGKEASKFRVTLEYALKRYVVDIGKDGKVLNTSAADRKEKMRRTDLAVEASVGRIARETEGKKAVRFAVFGDCRSNSLVFEAILRSIALKKPDFAVVLGDLVARGKEKLFEEYFIPPVLRNCEFPLLPVAGNHDIEGKGEAYEKVFGKRSRCYRFSVGDFLFAVLDNSVGDHDTVPWNEQLAQAEAWFKERAWKRKFVFVHKPPSTVRKWSYHAMSRDRSEAFSSLMSRHKVDHVFFGHIHAYSTATHEGVGYTVTGGGGAPLHDRFGDTGRVHHYLIVDVDGEKLRITGVRLVPVVGSE
jgi:predicted phosphodiesterase